MTTGSDFGLQRTSSDSPEDVARLPHSGKLQHSPSLPNLSSPSSNSLEMPATTERNQRPTAPPSPKASAPIGLPNNKNRSARHVKYASIDPSSRRHSGYKTHTRRRTDRDQPHALLTPPLTPSSSIRTTASIGTEYSATSTAHSAHDLGKGIVAEDIVDPDPEATRILVLENVNPRVDHDTLKRALIYAFEKARAGNASFESANDASSHREPVKGLNQRCQESEGRVYALFYDARVAKAIIDFLADGAAAANLFRDCAAIQFGEGVRPIYPTVRSGSHDELHQKLGPSEFLRTLDASFSLSVEKAKLVEEGVELSPLATKDADAARAKISISDSGIDVAILLNILKHYGDLRSFNFSRQEVNQDLSSTCFYSVEYFDVRDCDEAWRDLDQTTKYGLVLRISGNKLKPVLSSTIPATVDHSPDASSVTSITENLANLNIGASGISSQQRVPFFHPAQGIVPVPENGIPPSALPVVLPPGGPSSPPFFYATAAGEPAQPPPHLVADPSDTGAQVLALAQRPPSTVFLDNDGFYRHGAVSPCYNHENPCTWCPTRGAFPGVPYTYSSFTTPPPGTPVLYYPPPLPSTPQLLSPPVQPWPFDPALAPAGPGGPLAMGGMVAGPPPSSPIPFFARDRSPGVPPGGRGRPFPFPPYAGSPMPMAFGPPGPQAPVPPQGGGMTGGAPPEGPRSSNAVAAGRLGGLKNQMSPPANDRHQLVGEGEGQVSDRNTLNLDRIREGVDTRTTIMIKNIPNKMSDADLTAYIAKVCPRAIDFLYLRMDFRNGCNVGYAFVNFITVQDLLRFADARLGVRWNMFSSEKVLQMSYANYQSKESLIEKFKNSAIMDERESWRPRIFYSGGHMKGLPEPFPMPTHIRRKERSSHNRGTLFPPGMNSHTTGSHRRLLAANSDPQHPPPSVSSPFASSGGRGPGSVNPMGFRGGKSFL